jgi:purine-binding chemotaxis protein CheW
VGKYLTFRVAGREFAMDATRVRGILPIHELVLLETLPAGLRGVAMMGGRDFPVVDLKSKLGLTKALGGRTPCIVVVEVTATGGARLVGFVADRVSAVVQLRERDFRNGIARTKGRRRRVLDPDEILHEELE